MSRLCVLVYLRSHDFVFKVPIALRPYKFLFFIKLKVHITARISAKESTNVRSFYFPSLIRMFTVSQLCLLVMSISALRRESDLE